ncbi:hypothetical protein DFH06DRAFT_709665 [Mycena polygramma]|nr:hypothetical protein DFH06DRAFT_709665 [Mycena polygramma]
MTTCARSQPNLCTRSIVDLMEALAVTPSLIIGASYLAGSFWLRISFVLHRTLEKETIIRAGHPQSDSLLVSVENFIWCIELASQILLTSRTSRPRMSSEVFAYVSSSTVSSRFELGSERTKKDEDWWECLSCAIMSSREWNIGLGYEVSGQIRRPVPVLHQHGRPCKSG